MRLKSPHFAAKLWPTAAHIRPAFRLVGHKRLDDNPYLILDDVSDFCQGYMQAIRQKDGWWVEIRPGGGMGPKHYRSPEAMTESVAAGMFEQFLRFGNGVLDRFAWDDVTEAVDRAMEYWEKRLRISTDGA